MFKMAWSCRARPKIPHRTMPFKAENSSGIAGNPNLSLVLRFSRGWRKPAFDHHFGNEILPGEFQPSFFQGIQKPLYDIFRGNESQQHFLSRHPVFDDHPDLFPVAYQVAVVCKIKDRGVEDVDEHFGPSHDEGPDILQAPDTEFQMTQTIFHFVGLLGHFD
jgi:hypothetical protein